MITATKTLTCTAYVGQVASAHLVSAMDGTKSGYRWTQFHVDGDTGGWELLTRWYATRKIAKAAAERIGCAVLGYIANQSAIALGSIRSPAKTAACRANLAISRHVPAKLPRCQQCAGKARRCAACVAYSRDCAGMARAYPAAPTK